MTTYPAPMPWILPACANGPQIGQMAITVALSARINSRYRARNLCLSQPIPPTETLPLNPLFRLRLQSPNWQWKPSCPYHRLIFAHFIPAFHCTFYDHLIGHVKTEMKLPAVKYLQILLWQYKKDWAIIMCHSRCIWSNGIHIDQGGNRMPYIKLLKAAPLRIHWYFALSDTFLCELNKKFNLCIQFINQLVNSRLTCCISPVEHPSPVLSVSHASPTLLLD